MESALIVSRTEKSTAFFLDVLRAASIHQTAAVSSCGEARRLLLERSFDLVIVNALLRDESGERFSRDIASTGTAQVILLVKNEYFDPVSAVCENDGVLTIAKPVNKTVFWSALMLAKSAHHKIRRVQAENARLQQKIKDIRIVDRAKCTLISRLGMSEQEAHRYLEKQAMNTRRSRREIAERIIEAYEN
ncbi:MAG: ANTAR domain-containing protein [Oscillospiraceae bacterium]|nr:ANTAR domain-containing protein [Oscillospiraceae bacterium]